MSPGHIRQAVRADLSPAGEMADRYLYYAGCFGYLSACLSNILSASPSELKRVVACERARLLKHAPTEPVEELK